MRGLVVWGYSDCRSTMGLFGALKTAWHGPVDIALWHFEGSPSCSENRNLVGFSNKEFSNIAFAKIGENYAKGHAYLEAHRGWIHIFCAYQKSQVFRRLMREVAQIGDVYLIMGEAPCCMKNGIAAFLWKIYVRSLLRLAVCRSVKDAALFINLSGDNDMYAKKIGWHSNKIISFGYYPPPIPGSNIYKRICNKPFRILSTGILSRYRGGDVLVKALKLLKDRGIQYEATITQDGELMSELRSYSALHKLPINFPGRVPMKELVHLYETCSVYVGSGRDEPWGMRLNDALNCGAPLVVSRGMGGVKLVDDYNCGLSFRNEDYYDLAEKLEILATDKNLYAEISQNVISAAENCTPNAKARELCSLLINKIGK